MIAQKEAGRTMDNSDKESDKESNKMKPVGEQPSAPRGSGGSRDDLIDAKRSFYRLTEIASNYDQQRFGGAGGGYVNDRETRIVAAMLPTSQVVADVASGTGRLLPALQQRAETVIELDASLPMLQVAASKSAAEQADGRPATRAPLFLQADAFGLPLAGGKCDAVTSIRLLFHFGDTGPLLKEFRRVVRRGGTLVCDTSTWSPRSLIPLARGRWGERVFTISRPKMRALAQATGWKVREEHPCFLVSPYLYRRLPLPLARFLERLERHVPKALLCRVYWELEAA